MANASVCPRAHVPMRGEPMNVGFFALKPDIIMIMIIIVKLIVTIIGTIVVVTVTIIVLLIIVSVTIVVVVVVVVVIINIIIVRGAYECGLLRCEAGQASPGRGPSTILYYSILYYYTIL